MAKEERYLNCPHPDIEKCVFYEFWRMHNNAETRINLIEKNLFEYSCIALKFVKEYDFSREDPGVNLRSKLEEEKIKETGCYYITMLNKKNG